MKFQVSSLNTVLVILRTKFKNENEQRAIPPKVRSFELLFLCTVILLNEIYLPIQFHVDASRSFKVLLRTINGRTDGRSHRWTFVGYFSTQQVPIGLPRLTDGRVDYYMPPLGGMKTNLG